MSYSNITQDEKTQLVSIIQESSEHPIDFDLFGEMIAVLSEDIPGLEFLSDKDLSSLTADCWEIYKQNPVARHVWVP